MIFFLEIIFDNMIFVLHLLPQKQRRGGRVVDRGGLENR